MFDLIIRNGTLVSAGGAVRADLAVVDWQIAEVASEIDGALSVIDATGLHIFPGVIDAHVHFNEPGRADWEGFATGSAALAAGGATLFFDMPLNAHPPTVDAAGFDLKLEAASASSLVDFALWGGIVPGNLDRLEELAERGVVGYKAFMSNSGIADFPACDDLTLYRGMVEAARLGRIVAVHAESDALTTSLAREAISQGRVGARDYLKSRPVIAELEAIGRAVLYAEETGCPLHIVHVSSGQGVRMVAEARLRGVDVSCETCPHYLSLTEDDVERLGAIAKCAPPIRSQEEQDALWHGLADGTLPMVASDHSPAPQDMKSGDNFFDAWGGISGCQSLLQILLTHGHEQRDLALMDVARITSGYVARRFNLLPGKGSLEIGADADITLVDMGSSDALQSGDLFYRHKHSPYTGKNLTGRIRRTMVRGTTVFHDGKIVSGAIGRLVTPHGRST